MGCLIIVRHGNTFAADEAPRRIGRRTDLPLVESGRAQARAIGRAFAGDGLAFTRILCSPLRRTRETAALILAEMRRDPPAIEPCDWLAEIDHGPDENALEADVVRRIGSAALAAWDAQGIAPPGWTVDAEARIAAWRTFFAAQGRDGAGDALLVTSNGAARFALLAAPGLAAGGGSIRLRTGAWGRILVDAGAVRLDGWDIRP